MKDGLFHKDIGLPDCSSIVGIRTKLTYSRHAMRACVTDRYGRVIPPFSITILAEQIIEVEVYNGGIGKAVIRIPHCETYDLVLALFPREGFVKTCWLNRKDDTHCTLDRTKYQTA